MIIADSSVWIDYLRRRESPVRAAMDALLSRDQVVMVGVVLAEVLQGVRSDREYDALVDAMHALPYAEATRETWWECGETMRNLRARIPGARLHRPRITEGC